MNDRVKKILRQFLLILLSWLGVFALIYWLIELFFMDMIIKNLPGSYQVGLGNEGYVLMQYSKEAVAPKNYIAILGDSYAYGTGEWLSHVITQKQADYSAAHIIHKKLNRDVVSFGMPGAGSMRAMLSLPGFFLASTRQFSRYDIKDPDTLVVYFYEGNDLVDNINELERFYQERGYDSNRIHDEKYFEHFLETEVVGKDPVLEEVKTLSFTDQLLLYRLTIFGFQDIMSRLLKLHPAKSAEEMAWPISENNIVDINGRAEKMGAGLQAPALELTASETELALYIFQQSLAKMHKTFPQSRILVVYIPSNLSSYKWLSKTVDAYVFAPDPASGQKTWQHVFYNATAIDSRSNYLCSQVENIVKAQNHGFLDTRGRIREETTKHIVHHAWDWLHFDRKGYQALGEEISNYLALYPGQDAGNKMATSACATLQ